MTNYESVEPDKVKDIFAEAFAVNKETGEVVKCFKLPCRLCLFRGNGCGDARRKWLDQPAFDPEKDIDWSKVPVDTPVSTYIDGRTSWSSTTDNICSWSHCNLYRPEDVEKYRKKGTENG